MNWNDRKSGLEKIRNKLKYFVNNRKKEKEKSNENRMIQKLC